jgi:hypothetical protein
VAVIVVLFILLSAASQLLSLALSQSVFAHYSKGAGNFDGIIVNCNRVWQNYFLADEVAYLPFLCTRISSRALYSVTLPVPSTNESGLFTYPIYKTASMILMQKIPGNATTPFNIFGLGNDANTDSLLKDALEVGSLPTGSDTYQAIVTDFIAGRLGLRVGNQLKIVGLYRDTDGNFSTTIFSKTITISGIISESKLNEEFNVEGVPVFASGEYGPQTAYAAGVRPVDCIGSGSPFFTYSDLHQGPFYTSCQLSPMLFAILSNNFLRDFYGSSRIGPSEVLFRFSNPPSGPSDLLNRYNSIYANPNALSGYETSMLWKSKIVLLGPGLLSLSSQTFDNAGEIASHNITADDLELGIEISPVINRLQTIANQTLLLVASASILGIILELAVFLIISPQLTLEIEIYKANGLGTFSVLRKMLASHSFGPITTVIPVTFAVVIVGALTSSNMIFPALLGLGFALLIAIQFSILVSRVMSHKEFKQLSKGRLG